MSGFPWGTFITAVVPAAGVLAGAALTGSQTSRAARTSELKADYAVFARAATELIEYRQRESGAAVPGELVSALQGARSVVILAGSFRAIDAASEVSHVAVGSFDPAQLSRALDEFLRIARIEVGSQRPSLLRRIRRIMGRWRY